MRRRLVCIGGLALFLLGIEAYHATLRAIDRAVATVWNN